MPTDYKRVLAERKRHDEEMEQTLRDEETGTFAHARPLKNMPPRTDIAAWVSRLASWSIRRRASRIGTRRERIGDFGEIFTEPAEEHLRNQGARCMDCGVPFCQSRQRLPDRQPDPRVERPRLPGPLARCARPAAQDQQLPRVHGPHVPRAVRRRLRARHHRPRRSPSRTSRTRSSTAASRRAGSRPQPPEARTGKRSRSSARVRRASPPPTSSTRPATRSPSTSARTASAGC